MFKDRTVGILGGLGPRASAHFLQLFIQKLNARGISHDGDFPRIVLLSVPLNDWGITGAHDKLAVARQLVDAVSWLKKAGAEMIAIPCNTAHEFYRDLAQIGVPIVNIIDETLTGAPPKIGVLCSRQTRDSGLYENRGHTVSYVEDQALVDAVIGNAMAGIPSDLDCLITQLHAGGAQAVVLGCTELSFCLRSLALPIIDSAERLAAALANKL